jgi:hypothetical protein
MSGKELQKRVTSAWQYAIGGATVPTDAYPCTGSTTTIAGLSTLRSSLAKGECTAQYDSTATVCSLSAVVDIVNCPSLTQAQTDAVWSISASLDQCWGSGASGFWTITAIANSNTTGRKTQDGTVAILMKIDPEPAHLDTSLAGGSGSWAYATYVNSLLPTTVSKWPGTWTAGSLAAGTPCSTYDLPAGSDAVRSIYATGSYRKCM